ncbi:MAG: hypothetical protein CMB80_05700 [Flammeovirgaceae bacterium]|nr:hypothetical protein [Flammeovirgaceae bacterium]|tara:strand:- start:1477 stop:1887 length:411 start_codon:yes stop_codon:yes gene_type:complete
MSEKDPLHDISNILELIQTYGGTAIRLSDYVAICVQHIELKPENNPDLDANWLQADLRELQDENWVVLSGSPRYIEGDDRLSNTINMLIQDFHNMESWLKPSAIETKEAVLKNIDRLKMTVDVEREMREQNEAQTG